MLSEYIQTAIGRIENNKNESSIAAIINSCIKVSIIQWQGFSSTSPDGTLKGLVDYHVNIYMTGLTAEDRVKKKKAVGLADPWQPNTTPSTATTSDKIQAEKGKKIRLTGKVRVTSITPGNLQGQIEDGTTISFTSNYELFLNDYWEYVYNPTTGIYTVYTASKPRLPVYEKKKGFGGGLSEQVGHYLFDQDPVIKSSTSVVTATSKSIMEIIDEGAQDLTCRIDSNTAAFIRSKKYYEFKNPMVGTPPVRGYEITKTIDLAAQLPTTTGQYITVAKYLLVGNVVMALVMTHTRYLGWWGEDEDPAMGQMYLRRSGEAQIKGEILLINRLTNEITKLGSSLVTAINQIRWSGYMDMILDAKENGVILAELSTSQNIKSFSYSTGTIKVKKEDRSGWYDYVDSEGVRHTANKADVEKKTTREWYTWLSQEIYSYGWPKKEYIKKTSSKSWALDFPKLTVKTYRVNSGGAITATSNSPPSLTAIKTLYEDPGSGFSSLHGYACAGGYVNCMLYQDIHSKDMPVFIGRCYDAWLQLPFPDDAGDNGYTIVTELGPQGQYHADKGKYHITPLPLEVIGFFGTAFHRIKPADGNNATVTLELVGDVPGDFGMVRSFLEDDTAGGAIAISGLETSTHTSLLSLNKLVSTDYIKKIRETSIFNVYTGGSGGQTYTNNYSVYHTGMGGQRYWNQGLRLSTQRFIAIKDKKLVDAAEALLRENPTATPLVVPYIIIFAGSYEYQIDSYVSSNEQYKAHNPWNSTEASHTGVYMLNPKPEGQNYWDVYRASLTWALLYPSNYPVSPRAAGIQYTVHTQETCQSLIADLRALDLSSYYINMSVFVNQYDTFINWGTGVLRYDGLLWWFSDRQAWKLEDNIFSGWGADLMYYNHGILPNGNDRGEDQGPGTISLQNY